MTVPFEKILTPGVRAGNTVERVGKMVEKDVCQEAIAAQMSHNSKTRTKYTARDVETLAKVYEDCKSKVLISKEQADALRGDAADSAVGMAPA